MGLLGHRTVIAKCPACKASTKVNAHPDKASIRCPRCQATIPLAFARKYTGEPPPKEPERTALKQEAASFDYGSEVPVTQEHTQSSSRRKPRRYGSESSTDFSYPDHSRSFTRYVILATALIVVLCLSGVIYLFWRESANSRVIEYTNNISDSLEYHEQAKTHLRKFLDPLEGNEARKNYAEIKGKIDFLANRRKVMTPPDIDGDVGLKERLNKLSKAEQELATIEEDVKKLSMQVTVKPKDDDPVSVSAKLGSSITSGPPPSPSQLHKTDQQRKPIDDKAVLVCLPGLTRSQWSDEFMRRFALLADDGDGKVTANWAGDLLTLEVRPVVDPARYATKINFGRLLYYSRTDRILTIEFKPEKVNNYQATGDRITPILIDLKQREKTPKILTALNQLNSLKVDPARQAEVAAVLETIAVDATLDATLRDLSIKLIPNWSGKESADLLIRLLDDKSSSVRLSAIDALVESRAPNAAAALVKRWEKQETDRITRALISIGSDAESQVLPFLNNNNSVSLRTEACRVLKDVGTNESLKPLLDLMNAKDQSPLIVNAAKEAMKSILDRQTNK